MLGVLRPFEAIAVERVRALGNAIKDDQGYLAAVLAKDRWWAPRVCKHLQLVLEGAQVKLEVDFHSSGCIMSVLSAVKAQHETIKRAVRHFIKRTLLSRIALAERCVEVA